MKARGRPGAKDAGMVYQVRMEKEAGPEDLLDGLTWTVWRVIAETRGAGCLEQHRWPELRAVLQKILAGRLVRYGQCGSLTQCRVAPKKVFWQGGTAGKPPTEIHILEVRDGVERLFDEVGAVVERHFGKELGLRLTERRAWRIDLHHQLRAAVEKTLYHSPECQRCVARKGFRERRLWRRP